MSLNFLMPINLVCLGVYLANVDYRRLRKGMLIPTLALLTGLPHALNVTLMWFQILYPDMPEWTAKLINALIFIDDSTTSVLLEVLYVVRLRAFFTQERHLRWLNLFCVIPCLYVVGSGLYGYPPGNVSPDTAFTIFAAANVGLAANSLAMHILLFWLLWQKCNEKNIGGSNRIEIFIPLFTSCLYAALAGWAISDATLGPAGVMLGWTLDMLALLRIHHFITRNIYKESLASRSNLSGSNGASARSGSFPQLGSAVSLRNATSKRHLNADSPQLSMVRLDSSNQN